MSNLQVNRAKFVFIMAVMVKTQIFCNFMLYRMIKLSTFQRHTLLPSLGIY